jgi:hypothetical protein
LGQRNLGQENLGQNGHMLIEQCHWLAHV